MLPRNYYQYVAVFIGNIGLFIAAFSMTWSSPILPKLTNLEDNPLNRKITPAEYSVLASISILGVFIGTFLCGYLAKKYGRRPIFLFLGLPSFVFYILMAFSTNIWWLVIARIATGLTVAGFFTVNTMYFAEISEISNRGLLGTAMTCFINLGLLFVLIIGPWTPFFEFHIILAIFPIIFTILAFFYLPESPYYLIQKDYNKAEECLKKLRGSNDVKSELSTISESLNEGNQVGLKDVISNRGLRRGLIIGIGLVLCQQLSGTAVIMSFGQTIFEEAGGNVPAEIGPIILTSIQFLVGFIAPPLVDKSGRKSLLLISHIGITAAHLLFAVYFFMKNQFGTIPSLSWLPLASLVLYITTYSLGSGPLPWTVIGEIFPLEVKNIATSVCIVFLNALAFIFLFGFNAVTTQIGMGGIFSIFSGLNVLCTIFIYIFVVETKGKSLLEIQKDLNSVS